MIASTNRFSKLWSLHGNHGFFPMDRQRQIKSRIKRMEKIEIEGVQRPKS
ncbi:hypothetical protein KNP414_01796 [Paenibacillus mucilaginosus KNP414]|uniref:Uncharacterized protein n=1 Tax=Paenibacillus mucilaginosus (strain KNP414) TaxID=1036673 RepID=F8FQK3_PAEMK|nr:hypothetical protein KNP414_01796 [Paenibacillus mucilaginosus KNP414]